MADEDVEVELISKGIRVIVNPAADKSKRQPTMMQNAFAQLFNDMNAIRSDLNKQGKHIQALNKLLLRKLGNL